MFLCSYTGAVGMLSWIAASKKTTSKIAELSATSGILSILGYSIATKNKYGILGALGYIFFGLVVGAKGNLGPIKKVDIFHYGLAASSLAFLWAFKKHEA